MSPRKPPEPPPVEIKRFTQAEIEQGIAKLRRRTEEIQAFKPELAVRPDDNSAELLARDIRDTIRDVFGPNSPEFRDNEYLGIWGGPMSLNMGPEEIAQGYRAGRAGSLQLVQNLIGRLEERRGDIVGHPLERARATFGDMELHPRIADVAVELFMDGHYSEAVFNASKALVNLVKERSGRHDLDGAQLMFTVFSKKEAVLAFNELGEQTDLDEQEGMMHLFAGAVLAIRNPGGHDFPEASADRAAELIGFLSLLAKRVQEARRPR